jgi:predicted DNA-binding transcriptional regulator AlpA
LRDVRQARAKELGRGRFAGKQYAAYLLGCAERDVDEYVRRGRFPNPVAQIGTYRVWETSDLKAYAAEKPYPDREPLELQDRIVTRDQLAKYLGLKPTMVTNSVGRKRWDKIPPPSGTMGKHHF